MHWRMWLDVPCAFAVEPGFTRAVHCRDFRIDAAETSSVWAEPTTGLVMLPPSFLQTQYHENALPIGSWSYRAPFWRPTKRTVDKAEGLTSVKPDRTELTITDPVGDPDGFLLIELLVDRAIVTILADAAERDMLKWTLALNDVLGRDEGWALWFNAIDDELMRKRNWLYVSWADIGLHFGQSGECTVWRYGEERSAAPSFVERFRWTEPGNLKNRGGYLGFLPIPRYGLVVMHAGETPTNTFSAGAAARFAVPRCHVVSCPTREAPDGSAYLFNPSPICVATNPFQQYQLAFFQARYPSSGNCEDAPFDPGWAPTVAPSAVEALTIEANPGVTAASAELRKADGSGAWLAGTDRKGRVKLTLTTTDARYTPFVTGYGASWAPVMATRATTPVQVTTLERVELTEDYRGRIEGAATLRAEGAALVAIAERGDATFVVEASEDGVTWDTVAGGLAKEWSLALRHDGGRTYYRAECRLFSMHERLREAHAHLQTAFDGMKLSDACQVIVRAGGFSGASVPMDLGERVVPSGAPRSGWRYGVREGDDCASVLERLLLLGRAQGREYAATYDWDAGAWTISARLHDESDAATWTLVPWQERALFARRWVYLSARFETLPPECNLLVMEGLDQPSSEATRQTVLVSNADSVSNPASIDYLGRVVTARYKAQGGGEGGVDVRALARMVERLAMHRAITGQVEMAWWVPELRPNTRVRVLKPDGSEVGPLWVKRRTVRVEPGFQRDEEAMTLELDSTWEGDLP